MAKAAAASAKKAISKTQMLANIAETTGLSKKDVGAVVDAMSGEIKKALGSRGPGAISIPGLVKISKKKVPARKEEKNWKNPFTGEIQTRPAKPSYTKVSVRALKGLKDMV
jgi:nucleoid DNA-binding protein